MQAGDNSESSLLLREPQDQSVPRKGLKGFLVGRPATPLATATNLTAVAAFFTVAALPAFVLHSSTLLYYIDFNSV